MKKSVFAGCLMLALSAVQADENLFGYVKGAETLPIGSYEGYQIFTQRKDKSVGDYTALDSVTELEYGVSDKFTVSGGIKLMQLDTDGLWIDGYLPGPKDNRLGFSGFEASMKYNFLSPALDDIGVSGYWSFDYLTVDPHSGQDKKTMSLESMLIVQKYWLEGQLIGVANFTMEGTYAKRDEIDNLPDEFEWPTDPEMEIEFKLGGGLSYRFRDGWFVGGEAIYETEFETEVGQERWSWFAGPNLHYADRAWWATLTLFKQLSGGGEQFDGQESGLHLIEKTKNEVRLKLGYNF